LERPGVGPVDERGTTEQKQGRQTTKGITVIGGHGTMRLCFYESSHAQGATGLRSDQDERVGVTKVKVAITKATHTDEKSGKNCCSFEATPSIHFKSLLAD
jgi:hypothetical protein